MKRSLEIEPTTAVADHDSLIRASRTRASALIGRTSLTQRFMVLSLGILLIGAFVIGRYVSGEIEDRVLHRTSAITALYVDSVITPHLQELAVGHDISEEHRKELDQLMIESDLGRRIASFKVWHTDGEIVYAKDHALIGRRYPIGDDLQQALDGSIAIEESTLQDEENVLERLTWDKLTEIYAPVRETGSGRILGAMEIYEDPADLKAEVADSQRKGWLIVGGSTGVMYLLLVGMVSGASRTIDRQHRRVEILAEENAALADRVKRAAARKTETDELLLKRVAQDLHDGPAQDVSLALLRVDAVQKDGDASGDVGLMRTALQAALRELREISSDLRMPEIESLPLGEVIKKAARDHEEKTADRVRVAVCKGIPDVDLPTKIAIYRVTQEALNNASRHAGVTDEQVRVSIEAGNLLLEIADKGSGFEAAAPRVHATRGFSLGIRGMRERMEMLGGRLEISSKDGEGTVVQAVLPLMGLAE
ncbi:MAG: sensor histidine kinase [Dehalococcoidia bacterium]